MGHCTPLPRSVPRPCRNPSALFFVAGPKSLVRKAREQTSNPQNIMKQVPALHPAIRPKCINALAAGLFLLAGGGLQAQQLVDNFNRVNSNTVGNGWVEFETAAPASVRVQGNRLRMTSTTAGRDYAAKVTPGTYFHTLDSNRFRMEWAFNLRQSNLDPMGFANGRIGAAVVLAGSNLDLMSGNGYAVALGQPGTADPIRLVRYSGGLSSDAALTDLITVGDFGREYLSVRVTYEPLSGTWSMYYTDGGVVPPFADPLAAATFAGSVVDRTYTEDLLPHIGCFNNHGTSSGAWIMFDDIHVPEDRSTSVFFAPLTSASISSEAGTHAVQVGINNPHPTEPVFVDVYLQSGGPSTLGGWTTQTVKFEPASTAPQTVDLGIREYGGCAGDEVLVLGLQNLVGGVDEPYFGLQDGYTLTVEDRANIITVLEESFETDGDGLRYTQSISNGTGGGGYFLRAIAADIAASGSPLPTNTDGSHLMGALRLNSLAANAEASVVFSDIDVLGMSSISVDLKVGARNGNFYDNAIGIRDYLYVEINVDGAGWTTVGAFRSTAPGSNNSRPMAQDTDFDGVGDGAVLKPNMRNFRLAVPGTGSSMDVRIRFRTNAANEEIYFDRMRVRGSLCQPVYYSNAGGLLSDPIWSNYRTGATQSVDFDKHATVVVQEGHFVTNDSDIEIRGLAVEADAEFQMASTSIDIVGDRLHVDGLLSGGQGSLRLASQQPLVIEGTGTLNLFDLTIDTDAGVTAAALTDIRGTLQLERGLFTASEQVRLRSSANGTGRLGPISAIADYSGDLTVERYIPAGATNWRLMGSPVDDVTVADWNDDFITTGFPDADYPDFDSPVGSGIPWANVRVYDETIADPDLNVGLVGVSSLAEALSAGRGFAIWSGTGSAGTSAFMVDVSGPPHIARTPIALPLTFTDTGNPAADGWNLVSNPLPSPIDFTAIARGPDVLNSYWIYDPATGNNISWSAGFSTGGANGILQSSQAFWMRTNGSDISASVLEDAKVNTLIGGTFGGQQEASPLVRLKITGTGNQFSDETLVVFAQGSPARSADEGDADKMLFGHPSAPRIATLAGQGIPLAISMYGPVASDITIPVMVQVGVSGTYTVAVEELIAPGVLSCVSLEDLVTGAIVPLSQGATYTLELEAGTDPTEARLLLHATAPMDFTVLDVACAGGTSGQAVLNVEEGPLTVIWSDAFGTVLGQQEVQSGNSATLEDLPAGNYNVQVVTNTVCATLDHAFTVVEPFAIDVQLEVTAATCASTADGSIALEVLGGTAPFTYQWSTGSTEAGLTEVPSGVYALAVSDANGCTVALEGLVVEAAFSIAGEMYAPTTADVGQELSFTSSADAATDHLWDLGDGTTSNELSPTHVYATPGVFTVRLTLSVDGCERTLEQTLQVSGATGIQDRALEGMSAWNADGNIVLLNSIGHAGGVRVVDATGRIVALRQVASGTERVELSTNGWPTGIYHLQFMGEAGGWATSLPVGY